jgi:drug/metabolite transporter (DMT)-like permease
MKRLLDAAYKTLPFVALLFFAGVVAIAFFDFSPSENRLAFTFWCLACAAVWAVGCHEVLEQDDQ